jgi:hypothetical protein
MYHIIYVKYTHISILLSSQFSFQMCFLLVSFVHKLDIIRDITDVFAILIYLETIVTTLIY